MASVVRVSEDGRSRSQVVYARYFSFLKSEFSNLDLGPLRTSSLFLLSWSHFIALPYLSISTSNATSWPVRFSELTKSTASPLGLISLSLLTKSWYSGSLFRTSLELEPKLSVPIGSYLLMEPELIGPN